MSSADETDPLMPIGMFSRASLVSIKALRSYHDAGLLVPAEIDATTNYRSYRVSQLPDAIVVKRLRDLDLPLADIAEVVRARDPEVTRKVVAQHEYDMRQRLADVTRIVDELQLALDVPSLQTLFTAVDVVGAVPLGSGSARYPAAVDGLSEPVEAYVPIAEPVPVPAPVQQMGVVLALIPQTTCAVATHCTDPDTRELLPANQFRTEICWPVIDTI